VDDDEHFVGIDAQADLPSAGQEKDVAVLAREVSRGSGLPSR
jgi:hypothetical protein